MGSVAANACLQKQGQRAKVVVGGAATHSATNKNGRKGL